MPLQSNINEFSWKKMPKNKKNKANPKVIENSTEGPL